MQRNKGLSKNLFKIEIYINIFGYSVKFDVRGKKEKIKDFKGGRGYSPVGENTWRLNAYVMHLKREVT